MSSKEMDYRNRATIRRTGVLLFATVGLALAASPVFAQSFCSKTASNAMRACIFEAKEENNLIIAECRNLSDSEDRGECTDERNDLFDEALEECADQHDARLDLCATLGEGRYDPDYEAGDFVDPLEIGSSVAANPWFPLVPGFTRVYEAGDETITVVVTGETREIDGVTTIVVRDTVDEDGELIEDTDDYYAQDMDGNVWYFGELSKNYEEGHLVDLDGSFLAGEEGAKPGILFFADPVVGTVYRQEYFLGEAEDVGEVISTNGSEMSPAASCNGTCVVIRDFTTLEPDVDERKFFAEGIGVIVAFDTEEPDDREELVDFFMDDVN